MKRILLAVAVVALIMFAILLLLADVAYPMHIGEPSYYHVMRIYYLNAAGGCGIVAIVAATVAANF